MPINGWYGAGNADNVTDDGNLLGWADQSGQAFGTPVHATRRAYCFGPVVNNFGTWAQMVVRSGADLSVGVSQATGLAGHMPANPAPDNNIWIQGHLINSDFGGDGSMRVNLVPLCHNVNMAMKKFDNAIKRLVNADGAMTIRFNPNNIGNSRIIYRVHATQPPAGTNPNPAAAHPFAAVPNGVVMSLGIVINGAMVGDGPFAAHFTNPPAANLRWFANGYYLNGDALKPDVLTLRLLIGGVELRTP